MSESLESALVFRWRKGNDGRRYVGKMEGGEARARKAITRILI